MNLREMLRPFVDSMIVPVVWYVRPLRSLLSYVGRSVGRGGHHYLKKKFIENGQRSNWDKDVRADVVKRFERIDRTIPSLTSATDGLFLAEALLSMDAEGSVVECGCYSGASTAKLSIICKLLGRQLYVFDSFEGLPGGQDDGGREYSVRRITEGTDWHSGSFAAGLDQVRAYIEKRGEISVCTFYKGWFHDTLTSDNLPREISFAFTDVDLPASARDCLVAIWPRLSEGGVYFSHDVAFLGVLQTILDERLWRDDIGQFPPVLFGAGTGLAEASPHLGFAVKGSRVSPEYINSLSIEK